MRRHSSAHLRHALAQSWQWSAACFSHSAAQASQIIAHTRQTSRAKRALPAMNEAANRQMAAHSRSSRMQSRIMSTLASCKHAVAQRSQASAQALQAAIQSANGVGVMPGGMHRAYLGCLGLALGCESRARALFRNTLTYKYLEKSTQTGHTIDLVFKPFGSALVGTLGTSFLLSPSALAECAAGSAARTETRYFSFQDHRYLYRDERQSGAALMPEMAPTSVPLVVFLHGVNPTADLHLWLGGGGRDLRPLAAALMQSGEVVPFVLAAPSQTKAASSPRALWTSFELGAFVDAVVQASAGSVQIDRERVVLMGHSGAGCNPNGGLATELGATSALPLAVVSVDPCLDLEMGTAMSRRPASVPLLLWWQSAIWRREPLAFWAGLTMYQSEPRTDRMQELEVAAANPHDAILPLAFELAVRELFGRPRSPSATEGSNG